MKSILLHSGIALYYVIAWKGVLSVDYKSVQDSRLTAMRGLHTRYLTVWNFVLQTIVFGGYFLYDIIEATGLFSAQKRKLKHILDYYFYCLVAPTSLMVAVVFWVLYSYDKGSVYIYPDLVDKAMPYWVNHALHTVIMLTVILQARHNKVIKFSIGQTVRTVTVLSTLYLICLYGTYFQKKIWIYPFFGKLTEPFRFAVVLMLYAVHVLFCYTTHYANILFCGSGEKSAPTSAERKKRKS